MTDKPQHIPKLFYIPNKYGEHHIAYQHAANQSNIALVGALEYAIKEMDFESLDTDFCIEALNNAKGDDKYGSELCIKLSDIKQIKQGKQQ